MTINFEDHDVVQSQLEKDQHDERDQRNLAREDQHFVHDVDGMWEDNIVEKFGDRPRYTFDMVSGEIDDIAGEIEQNEFQANVKPAGGGASKDTAKTLNGLIRSIQVSSRASRVYQKSGRKMLTIGFDAWRVISDFESDMSFKQALKIQKIDNAINRVWFDSNSVEEDRSDARWVFDMRVLNKNAYWQQFPDGSGQSLSTNEDNNGDNRGIKDKRETIAVAEILYKKEIEREVIEFSDGSVFIKDEKLEARLDELAKLNITPVREPVKRKMIEVWSRWFDGGKWLTEPQKTPFKLLPICPVYGNFDVVENQISYQGVVRKLIDPQRVLNYSESRQIEEGAISPFEKIWMTESSAAGHEKELEQMNVSHAPVQLFNNEEGDPLPFKMPGASINPSLANTSDKMATLISRTNRHTDPKRPVISGVALERAENKGDTSNIKYHNSLVVGIEYTCRVLLSAIPVVYDTRERQVTILQEDGAEEVVELNKTIRDEQTNQLATLNDMSVGEFDVTCSVGAAFQNKQQEAVDAQLRVGAIMPEVLQTSADILLRNINAPGMNLIADRVRAQLFDAGAIPEEQWTDEEKQKALEEIQRLEAEQAALANQGPPPLTPVEQAVVDDAMSQIKKRQEDTSREFAEFQLKLQKQQQDFQLRTEELALKGEKMELDEIEQARKNFETTVEQLKTLTEAWSQGILGPPAIPTIDKQANLVLNAQDEVAQTTGATPQNPGLDGA